LSEGLGLGERRRNGMDTKEQLFKLWRMLDDIDTLDDACRDNDAAFRALVRDVQRKRFEVLTGEEFHALWRVYGPNFAIKRLP
jgi:hypothetical protein